MTLTYLSITTASFFHTPSETAAGYFLVAALWAWSAYALCFTPAQHLAARTLPIAAPLASLARARAPETLSPPLLLLSAM